MTVGQPATEADCEFCISRIINAPRELVFDAWTIPNQLQRWWGPAGFTNPVCEIDLKPGGTHRLVMWSPQGIEYPMQGVFLEVVKPERLVMTLDCAGHPPQWHERVQFHGAPARPNPVGEMIQTVTFEDIDSKTKLTIRTRFESAAIREAMSQIGMTEGWSQSLDRLQQFISSVRAIYS